MIDTADASVIRKLDRLCQKHPDTYACTRVDDVYKAKRYSLTDCRFIRFGWPASEAVRERGRRNSGLQAVKATRT